MPELSAPILAEAFRVEEDAEFSAKGHFNAAGLWQVVHLFVGLPVVVLAALASASFFLVETPRAAAVMSALAAALAAVATFLNPSDRANQHRAAARRFLTLRNETRVFRTIRAHELSDEDACARVGFLSDRRNDLNEASPDIPRMAYERARRDIESGRAQYQIDTELQG